MDKFNLVFKPQNVLEHMQDDESKFIYEKYIAWLLSGNYSYIKEIVSSTTLVAYKMFLQSRSPLPKVLFGAGMCGKWLVEILGKDFFEYAIDNNADKIDSFPLKVMSFDEFIRKNVDVDIIIATYQVSVIREMYGQLLNAGIDRQRAFVYANGSFPGQYFDLPYLNYGSNEVFVDGGCYDMDSSQQFLSLCPNAKKVVAYEPDQINFKTVKSNAELLDYKDCEIKLINSGLSDKKGTLRFSSGLSAGSNVNKLGNTSITVTTIDDTCSDATFIKMDIEGSELEALKGARNTIITNKPKLAISIYHKPSDLWEIPAYLLELNPEYKLYLRHYSCSHWDTVLYAI